MITTPPAGSNKEHDGNLVSRYDLAMVDTRTPEQRRRIMQSVKTKDTGPERAVRRALFAAGYRYRLHLKDLPGSPDIVLAGRRKVIFVHGCFWHGHGCTKGRAPKSRTEYWGPKIEANRSRDERNVRELEAHGWKVLVLWQCEVADMAALLPRLIAYVDRS
jgi:DNA mismatch endonuclease (patch repair protein)